MNLTVVSVTGLIIGIVVGVAVVNPALGLGVGAALAYGLSRSGNRLSDE